MAVMTMGEEIKKKKAQQAAGQQAVSQQAAGIQGAVAGGAVDNAVATRANGGIGAKATAPIGTGQTPYMSMLADFDKQAGGVQSTAQNTTGSTPGMNVGGGGTTPQPGDAGTIRVNDRQYYGPDGTLYTQAEDGTIRSLPNFSGGIQYAKRQPTGDFYVDSSLGNGVFKSADGLHDISTMSNEELIRYGMMRDQNGAVHPMGDNEGFALAVTKGINSGDPEIVRQAEQLAQMREEDTKLAKSLGWESDGTNPSAYLYEYAKENGYEDYDKKGGRESTNRDKLVSWLTDWKNNSGSGSSGSGGNTAPAEEEDPGGNAFGPTQYQKWLEWYNQEEEGGGTQIPIGQETPAGNTPGTQTNPPHPMEDLGEWTNPARIDNAAAPEWNGTEEWQGNGPAPEWTGGTDNTWRDIDNYDYGQAPEWTGSDYERRRDEALQNATKERGGSEYQQKRDAALQRAEDMRWDYNPDTDPVWQAYQKQYRREGDRATQNTMGAAASMTGGIPSSYAATAAAQAGNYYASQLSDKLPELYNDAYNRYLQEFQRQMGISDQYAGFDDREYSRFRDQQNAGLNAADRYNQYGQQEYGQYQDRLGQYNQDRAFRYGVNRDAVSDAERANQTDYNRYLDAYDQWHTQNRESRGDWENDRNFDYGAFRDQRGDWENDRNFGRDVYENDRNFNYNVTRDQRSDYVDDRDFNRDVEVQDRQWQQQLREYADAQNWKSTEWNQYLREYGDQLTEKERQWAYQQAQDAYNKEQDALGWDYKNRALDLDEQNAEWERQRQAGRDQVNDDRYADETEYSRMVDEWERDNYDRQYTDEQYNDAFARLGKYGFVTERDAEILGVPAGTTLEDLYRMYGIGEEEPASGGGQQGGGQQQQQQTENQQQSGDGYNYVGTHPNGLKKTAGYDQSLSYLQNQIAYGGWDENMTLNYIRNLVRNGTITYEESTLLYATLFPNKAYDNSGSGSGGIHGHVNTQAVE